MERIKKYIDSGIIEAYVFGLTTQEETREVEQMADAYPEVRAAIDSTGNNIEELALANAVPPPPDVKPMVMATINYLKRLEDGEPPSFPPLLYENSRIADYAEWLQRPLMTLLPDFTNLHARIIGYTPEALTAIVWIKEMAPAEVHTSEYERFLVVEGTCDIMVEEEVHHLVPGNYFGIPLHKNHKVLVTSATPCKVILQRVAA